MNRRQHPIRDCNATGFTLIELAFAITVIGLLLSFGVTAWMSMKTTHQISATKTTLQSASSCLANYVLHSEVTPPQAYFTSKCSDTDSWGENIVYYNNGDGIQLTSATSKTVRDEVGDHPDALWLVVSAGPNGIIETTSSATVWDCSLGDDLCDFTSKKILIYETRK